MKKISTTNNSTNTNCNANSNPNPTGNNTNNYIPPRRPRFQGNWEHCRKWEHGREDCWFLKNNQFGNIWRANVCMPVSENVPQNRVE